MLKGKRVILGVSGGIAAYKAILLCRLLVEAGAYVVPVMTKAAQKFVGRATFDALASERVQVSIFGEADPIPHTTLGRSADLVAVAPATARLIGSYAAGISDGLLTATLLATRAPVVICPAMHTEMWEHPAVIDNLALLARRGVHIVEPESGRLAGGDEGAGRLAEPATIFEYISNTLAGTATAASPAGTSPTPAGHSPANSAGTSRTPAGHDRSLAGKSVIVTAGGTREAIDPVRFIGNRSSGRQGHELARAAHQRGASVTLVTTIRMPGPPSADLPAGIEITQVESAAEMSAAVAKHAKHADLVLMAAAVADFCPAEPAAQKIKKSTGAPKINLVPTVDILANLGKSKPQNQVLVGFAAETEDTVANASAKLTKKNLDLMVLNDVSAPGVGFEHDTNAVTILRRDGTKREVPLTSKQEVAHAVLDEAAALLAAATPGA